MTKNNYFHMKLREHREEIARLKEELEVSAKAALESESATAGMAAERDELPLSAHAAGMIAAVESENCPKNVTDYRGVTFDPTRV